MYFLVMYPCIGMKYICSNFSNSNRTYKNHIFNIAEYNKPDEIYSCAFASRAASTWWETGKINVHTTCRFQTEGGQGFKNLRVIPFFPEVG